ncbi:MAG TPA: amino acid permease [Steroidobacteraceae bacterium]|nr:amino acid permease [Steroidobacteraceae bacterium]
MNLRIKSLDDILATAEKKSLHRSLGAFQLTMLGVGAIIGTGIFVLTAEAAQKAGPAMMVSFVIAGFVCAVTALCYAEMASMIPVSGSAYTYSYAVLGEVTAWIVGWALILEYAIAGSTVAVGWSGYIVGLLRHLHELLPFMPNVNVPDAWALGPFDGGVINVPALVISGLVTWLLVLGTKESAYVNAILVSIKVIALTVFIILALPVMHAEHFTPFAPNGYIGKEFGVSAAAASIFFAYVGFDAVSTAAEETKNPNRNIPIGLIGSLAICTVFYLLVAAAAIGSVGAQPVFGAGGAVLEPGSPALAAACKGLHQLVCSKEPLAYVLRELHFGGVGNLLGLAAGIALPSVILMMIYGQTRIFFVMARDGLLPEVLSTIHPRYRTPHVVTIITGLFVSFFAALFPVGKLADISNSGTLFAFLVVAAGVMILRVRDPGRARTFRTPAVWIIGPLAIAGCVDLFFSLSNYTELLFISWTAFGLLLYFSYGRHHSHHARAGG